MKATPLKLNPPFLGENQKGTAGRGREKKMSRQFATNGGTAGSMGSHFQNFATPGGPSATSPPGGANTGDV